MATPTNLVELAQNRHEDWSAWKMEAQSALAQVQSDLQAATNALALANQGYGEKEKEVADLRTQLAAIATPADGAPLLEDLKAAIIALRAASAAILSAEEEVGCSKSELDLAQTRLQDAGLRTAAAKTEWDRAKADAARRKAAVDALPRTPLSTLAAKAAALLSSQTFSDAKTRIKNDFPEELRDRARERAQLAADLDALERRKVADVLELYNDLIASKGNGRDKLGPFSAKLDDAESALVDFVAKAKSRYDRAEARLKRVGGSANPPLTQEQKDHVSDASLETERKDAADKQSSRDAATLVRERQQAAFEMEQLKVLAEGGQAALTAALADANSDVAKAKKALDDAEADLQQKENDFTAAMADALDAWEAALPDSAWRDLYEFDEASADLDGLKIGGQSLADAMANAETGLVQAAVESDDDERQLRVFLAEGRRQEARADIRGTLANRAAFAALRGDK